MPTKTRTVALRAAISASVLIAVALVALRFEPTRAALRWVWSKARGGYTVAERVVQYGPAAEARLRPQLAAVGLPYPPAAVALLAFKDTRTLEVYGRAEGGPWARVTAYPILGASGGLGPKLAEGDQQVPEGVYAIESLNPNSRFHLSLRLDYPNAFDRAMAQADGRDRLGGDIMIHGGTASIGCLAMGDPAAEDLFVLTAAVGAANVQALISPTDLRDHAATPPPAAPPWTATLYADLHEALRAFPR